MQWKTLSFISNSSFIVVHIKNTGLQNYFFYIFFMLHKNSVFFNLNHNLCNLFSIKNIIEARDTIFCLNSELKSHRVQRRGIKSTSVCVCDCVCVRVCLV